jgi:hypothetical protein
MATTLKQAAWRRDFKLRLRIFLARIGMHLRWTMLALAATVLYAGRAYAQSQSGNLCPPLIEFSGDQGNPADAQLPDVSGRVLIYYWSELEPSENKFDFSTMDREAAVWAAAGKTLVFRFSTAGWSKWKQPWSQEGTPRWALRKYRIPIVTERDGAVLPVYWSRGYFTGLSGFLGAVSAHIQASSYRNKIGFIEIAVGDGGETKPDTEQNKTPAERAARLKLWHKAGYANTVWYTTVGRVIEIYKRAFPSTPLALMPDASYLGGPCTLQHAECRESSIVALGNKAGLILQDNGFDRKHLYAAEWRHGKPLACEQLRSATRQGYALADDLKQSVAAGCGWLLVFRQDLVRSDFQKQVSDFYKDCPE